LKNNPVFKSILYALQGAIVGVGAILPGVSGGVLCVAFGIYEPMMALLTHPVQTLRAKYKMFVPFLLGWAVGFIFLAKGVELLFQLSPTVALRPAGWWDHRVRGADPIADPGGKL